MGISLFPFHKYDYYTIKAASLSIEAALFKNCLQMVQIPLTPGSTRCFSAAERLFKVG